MLKNKKDIILIVCMFLGLTVLGFTYKYLTSTNEKKAVENIHNESKLQNKENSSENKDQNSEIYEIGRAHV